MASPESSTSLSISLAGELPCSDLPAQCFIVILTTGIGRRGRTNSASLPPQSTHILCEQTDRFHTTPSTVQRRLPYYTVYRTTPSLSPSRPSP